MKKVLATIKTLPYKTQSSMMVSLAPNKFAKGRIHINPMIDKRIPTPIVTMINIEKYRFACSCFFSPKVLEINALPPVPIINPNEPSAIRRGIMRLTAAKAFLPTIFDTKNPSTML